MIAFEVVVIDNGLVKTVSAEEIKRDFPAYLERVEAGETFVVMQAGKPVAEIKPVASASLRPFGLCAGEFTLPDDFDEPLPESVIDGFR